MNSDISAKKRILDTAEKLFGERGIHGVSTADIAAEAHVNKALIFYYFGSKEELYRAVFRKLILSLKDMMEISLKDVEPGLSMIETFVRTHIDFLMHHQNIMSMIVRELLSSDTELSPLLTEISGFFKPLSNTLLVALATAKKRGEIRDVDPLQTIVNIISLDIFFFLGNPILTMINPLVNSGEFRKQRVDHVVDQLMNGLRKQSGHMK